MIYKVVLNTKGHIMKKLILLLASMLFSINTFANPVFITYAFFKGTEYISLTDSTIDAFNQAHKINKFFSITSTLKEEKTGYLDSIFTISKTKGICENENKLVDFIENKNKKEKWTDSILIEIGEYKSCKYAVKSSILDVNKNFCLGIKNSLEHPQHTVDYLYINTPDNQECNREKNNIVFIIAGAS